MRDPPTAVLVVEVLAVEVLAVEVLARLFEQLLWRYRDAVGDVGRAVGNFQQLVTQRTAKLARLARPRRQFDAAETGMAFRTDDVAFSHGAELCPMTVTVRRRECAFAAKVERRRYRIDLKAHASSPRV